MTEAPFEFEKYLAGAQGYAVISRGSFGFRYGPFPVEELGQIISKSIEEDLPVFVSIDCSGQPFDYQLARNMRGFPVEESECVAHVASEVDPSQCRHCGTEMPA